MTDSLYLRAVKLPTACGVHDWEKKKPQQLLLDAVFYTSFDGLAATDNLADALDYEMLVQRMRSLAASRHFNLLETLAEQIALMLLAEFSAIQSLEIAISKPHAVADVEASGVRLVRNRR